MTVLPPFLSRLASAVAFLVLLALGGCSSTPEPTVNPVASELTTVPETPAVATLEPRVGGAAPLRLVTLGDTYTSGWPLGPQYSWPAQLVRTVEPALTLAGNLAGQGQTSANVIAEQLVDLPGWRPQVVTIQVGVNDIISPDIDLDDYRANVRTILDTILATVPAGRVFAIGTPDYTLTPHGGDFGERETVRGEIREANAILADEAAERGIAFIDVSPVSDRVADDPTLVATDGLSPSAKQYAGWVELIAPHVRDALGAAP